VEGELEVEEEEEEEKRQPIMSERGDRKFCCGRNLRINSIRCQPLLDVAFYEILRKCRQILLQE
jgi:hypothetical protein